MQAKKAVQIEHPIPRLHSLVAWPRDRECRTIAVVVVFRVRHDDTEAVYAAAQKDVKEYGHLAVPAQLRNAPTTLMKDLGFGAGYQYPHNFEGHYVAQEYLPDELRGRRYYEPTGEGREAALKERVEKMRAARAERPAPAAGNKQK